MKTDHTTEQATYSLADTARRHEPDRFLAASLASGSIRADLVTVAAFASELRQIPDAVSDPMLGEIRLQWWRDRIESWRASAHVRAIDKSGHPLADALAEIVVRRRLPIALLSAMAEARSFDLYPDPMPDEVAFAGYVAKTETAQFRLAAHILVDGGTTPDQMDAAADAAGRAHGTARMLYGLAFALAKSRLVFPVSRLADVDVDTLFRGELDVAARAGFATFADDSRVALAAARRLVAMLPKSVRPAFLPLAMVEPMLRKWQETAAAGLRHPKQLAPIARVWRIGLAHLKSAP
jgi:15-cis-phytoene synthase